MVGNFESMNTKVPSFLSKIAGWHHDRNLIEGATDKDQLAKLIQEVGELSDNICKSNSVADDIGDIIVVLVNIAERNNLDIEHCLAVAWDDIKDRKGVMVDGIFIKEADMVKAPKQRAAAPVRVYPKTTEM